MKVKITCQKCKSTNVSITSDANKPTPMYKCNACGYEHNLFPKFESDKEGDEE